jgi:prepilin-type N-terminal cleavage/methylation domain-containing protein
MRIRSAKGFTLVELIVAVSLTAVVIGGACSVFYLVSASFKNGTVSASSQQKALLVENYLQKYAATADSVQAGTADTVDNITKDKVGIVFSIKNNILTIQEHTVSPSAYKTIVTVDGIKKIDFSAGSASSGSANSLNYTISFPDTNYTFRGGIVLNNCSVTTLTGAVFEDGKVLFLGKTG